MTLTEQGEQALELPELSVQSFAVCEVRRGCRLQGAAVDADTIYLVLAGTMHMHLPTGKLRARAGSLVLVPPGLQPGIAPASGDAVDVLATRSCLLQRAGLLVFDAAQGGTGDLRVMVGRVLGGLSGLLSSLGLIADDQPLAVDLTDVPLAQSAYRTLLSEMDTPGSAPGALSATLMKACLLLFIRSVDRRENRGKGVVSTASGRVGGIVAAIRAQPSQKYCLAELAAAAGMSRATFARRFVEATGTSPMEFVQQTRLQEAAAILRATDLPIKQIAAQAGFQSRSHFTRAFIAGFGTNPTSFRAAHRGPENPTVIAG